MTLKYHSEWEEVLSLHCKLSQNWNETHQFHSIFSFVRLNGLEEQCIHLDRNERDMWNFDAKVIWLISHALRVNLQAQVPSIT